MFLRKSLTLFALAATLATFASAQSIQINRENKTIAISTTDEATAIADIAAVTVGFSIYGPDSDSTYAHAGKLSQAILKALRAAGVPDKSIESASQGLQQNTDFNDKDTAEFRAQHKFVFSQSWTVSVSPKEAAEVIRLAIAAGANQTGAIDWRLSDRKALQAKAAQAALVKARAVASQMAEGLHVKLGELIYASNQTPNTQIYFAQLKGRFELNTESAGMAGVLMPPALEIRPQTVREEATVYAVFTIE
ncbi:MAG TPA: SIMPL domain-containing protein [Terracidiphilus sp.]|nr:SIMPL domain-containing protein [Terracidiphilus sp.]